MAEPKYGLDFNWRRWISFEFDRYKIVKFSWREISLEYETATRMTAAAIRTNPLVCCPHWVSFHRTTMTWPMPMYLFQAIECTAKMLPIHRARYRPLRPECDDDRGAIATDWHWWPTQTSAAKIEEAMVRGRWKRSKWKMLGMHDRTESWIYPDWWTNRCCHRCLDVFVVLPP